MAFETAKQIVQSVNYASGILDEMRTVYQRAKSAKARVDLYVAGTDPKFNATVNTIFSAAERAELNAMVTQLNSLITDWETNHSWVMNGAI